MPVNAEQPVSAAAESFAEELRAWRERLGLSQAEDYARAIITSGRPDLPADAVERDVAARMARQEVLDRDEPPFCWFILGEAALRSWYGGPEVMRAQLAKLAEYARRPRITVQVFPFATPDCPGSEGPVTIFDFAESDSVGYAEGYQAGRIIEAPADMARLVMMFDHLRAGALTPAESARFIDGLVQE
jgi:uncharacterized protein DUF5753